MLSCTRLLKLHFNLLQLSTKTYRLYPPGAISFMQCRRHTQAEEILIFYWDNGIIEHVFHPRGPEIASHFRYAVSGLKATWTITKLSSLLK